MSNDYKPPSKNTPVALRLVPLITGYSIKDLVSLITEPTTYCERDDYFYLTAYQWLGKNRDAVELPRPSLRIQLQFAVDAPTLRAAIEAIPPDLFIYSKDIEGCVADHGYEKHGRNPPYHELPNWSPNLHGIEDYITACPNDLTTICKTSRKPKHKPREEVKKETSARNALLQEKADEILKAEPGLNKDEICRKLQQMPEFKNMSKGLIKRNFKLTKN